MALATTPPNWKFLVDEYEQGASDVEIAKLLQITIAKFYQLEDENQAFAEFVARGRTLARAWWESQGRKNLWNKDFNTALWNFNMKNRFSWADKVDTNDTTNKEPVSIDQVRGQLSSALKHLAKTSPELLNGIHLQTKEQKKDE